MSKIRDMFRGKQKYITVKPGLRGQAPEAKRQMPDGLWVQCDQCKALIFRKELERTCHVCEKCGYHFPIGAKERLCQLLDRMDAFVEFDPEMAPGNPLGFPEYEAKKGRDEKKTGLHDAVVTGQGTLGRHLVVVAVLDFGFMGGSMGSVVGEKITRAFERATSAGLPVVVVSSSGGARMQEGIISLMQMQKTAAAVEMHSRAGLLYISVLVHPTTAGVYGSFASQGDIVIAEPGATVGFAGRSVIEAAVGKRVPADLQKAETVYQNGFIDMIVVRSQLKATLSRLLSLHGLPELAIDIDDDTPAEPGETSEVDAAPGESEKVAEDKVDTGRTRKRSTRSKTPEGAANVSEPNADATEPAAARSVRSRLRRKK